MGALPGRRDIFIEFGYMRALAGTTYGIDAPKGGVEHDHRPDPEALEKVGKAFANAPGSGIAVHFDLGDDYPAGTVAEPYLIRDTPTDDLARGGESIVETGCDPLENPIPACSRPNPGRFPVIPFPIPQDNRSATEPSSSALITPTKPRLALRRDNPTATTA